jgi:hypothetical protein
MIKETEDKGRRINEQQQQLLFCQSRGPKAAEQLLQNHVPDSPKRNAPQVIIFNKQLLILSRLISLGHFNSHCNCSAALSFTILTHDQRD